MGREGKFLVLGLGSVDTECRHLLSNDMIN